MSERVILGIETSCDETGVAVLHGDEVLSSVLATQTDMHARFGGVVPEVAARAHIEAIRPMVHMALRKAGVHSDQLDAVAATRGPGLVGSLMVGFSFGKALAWGLQKPFIGIDHMEGHLFAPLLENPDYRPPAVVLLASGGHSQIVHMRDWGDYSILGGTIDDAAGEAFDKLARFMGLGYPGGPAIDASSDGGDSAAIRFPRALADRTFWSTICRKRKPPVNCHPSRTSPHRCRRLSSTCLSPRHSTQLPRRVSRLLPPVAACWRTGDCEPPWRREPPRPVSSCACRPPPCAPTMER
jgi:tRNA A37 threonylcarbamoyltransferase TsaD